jgi:hypothetical protein
VKLYEEIIHKIPTHSQSIKHALTPQEKQVVMQELKKG